MQMLPFHASGSVSRSLQELLRPPGPQELVWLRYVIRAQSGLAAGTPAAAAAGSPAVAMATPITAASLTYNGPLPFDGGGSRGRSYREEVGLWGH